MHPASADDVKLFYFSSTSSSFGWKMELKLGVGVWRLGDLTATFSAAFLGILQPKILEMCVK